jgi:hypothetical protein
MNEKSALAVAAQYRLHWRRLYTDHGSARQHICASADRLDTREASGYTMAQNIEETRKTCSTAVIAGLSGLRYFDYWARSVPTVFQVNHEEAL